MSGEIIELGDMAKGGDHGFLGKPFSAHQVDLVITPYEKIVGIFGLGVNARKNRSFRAESINVIVRYGMPSYRPNTPEFEPKRYWRGPIWLVVNWMLLNGLARNGETELSERILSDSLALVEQGGFGEYFDPTTGEALGGTSFSWTAAMILFFQSLK